MDEFHFLYVGCFAIIFPSENVKYTHQSEKVLPCQNKQIMCHRHHLGFVQLCSFVLPSGGVLSLLDGNCSELGTAPLGIPPDGYPVWISAKFKPRPECVCWTPHCISGDHTGSISMSKSLCCPLSLSEHVPPGVGVVSSITAGNPRWNERMPLSW